MLMFMLFCLYINNNKHYNDKSGLQTVTVRPTVDVAFIECNKDCAYNHGPTWEIPSMNKRGYLRAAVF